MIVFELRCPGWGGCAEETRDESAVEPEYFAPCSRCGEPMVVMTVDGIRTEGWP